LTNRRAAVELQGELMDANVQSSLVASGNIDGALIGTLKDQARGARVSFLPILRN
jgi:hypothetical protein